MFQLTKFTPHVNDKSKRISNSDGSGDSGARRSITVPYFHITLRRTQSEHDWITRGHSVKNKKN